MNHRQLEDLKKILPVNPKILGKQDRFCSAVLVLLIFLQGEYHFIFQKRPSHIRQGGEVCFPGGETNPLIDRNSEETAIRETYEELGIPKDKVSVIGRLDTIVAPMGAIIDAFVAIADISGLEEIKIDPMEVEYVFTVAVSYFENCEPQRYQAIVRVHPSYINENGKEVVLFPAKELGLPDRYTKPWGEGIDKILVYQVEKETIWGITAKFIYDVVSKLNKLPNKRGGW